MGRPLQRRWSLRPVCHRPVAPLDPGGRLWQAHRRRRTGGLRDFREYVGALTSLGRPALYLTGDVHWGRFAELRDFTRGGTTTAFEIITSPCALVTTVGSDGLARAWGKLKGLFGAKDPWPRHDEGDMAEVPKHFPGPFLNPTTHHRQQGDQISVLSLQRQGSGAGALIKARLRYYPIHPDTKTRDRFRHNFEFTLRPNL
jgi:hypothetical protein